MEINEFGRNLNIICLCGFKFFHSWTALSFWYSVQKCLPEAQFNLACEKGEGNPRVFDWAYRLGIPILYYKDFISDSHDRNNVFLPSFTIASRTYDKDNLVVSSKSNDLGTFINYSEGVGSFIIDEAINNNRPPFGAAANFLTTKDMTLNELLVIKSWEKIDTFF
jgi:hypothetical protein